MANVNKLAQPVKLSDDRAENTLFTIRTTDHITHRNISLIGSLLTYLSKSYSNFQQKARTISHKDITLEEMLFFGKLVVHSNLFSGYRYEKVPSYMNYIVTRHNITHHILISRPQKILRAGNIEELGRIILYPLYPDNIF